MMAWMRKILFPYINEQRVSLGNQGLPALLIMDGLKAHLMNDIANELTQNNVLTVCLPAHSSHLLQVLDLSIFGPMKLYYRNAKSKLFENSNRKMAKKIEKIINSFYHATYMGNIYSGWNESGVTLNFMNGRLTSVGINRAKVLVKLG